MSAQSDTEQSDVKRRDFLYIATGTVAAAGTAAAVWPFIDQMNPDASTQALATVEVDVSSLEDGQSIRVKWRGVPVFIRQRTNEEVAEAQNVDVETLPDPYARNANLPEASSASDKNRGVANNEKLLIMIGVCTHLGCIPVGQKGKYGGWFCPCHGSDYDTAGRIRNGPAPYNLFIPKYEFISDKVVKIG